jgi:hypothetical protein
MNEKTTSPDAAEKSGPGYETTDVSGRFAPGFALAVILGALVLLPALWWMFSSMLARSQQRQPAVSPLSVRENERLPPQPRLEGIEPPNIVQLRQAVSDKILHGYGWVDRNAQIVRIPIDRAMAIVLPSSHSVSAKPNALSPYQTETPRGSNSGRMLKEVSP